MKLCDDAIHCGCSDKLEKESKRLEWLVENQCYPMRTKRGWCLTCEGNTCFGPAEMDDWRDVIDQAMRESKR